MNIFAYCAYGFQSSVLKAAGVRPVLSPPITMANFNPLWLQGHDLIYFKLHGLEGQPFWYNERWETAISAQQIRQATLGGAVVFVANCYLPESPMLAALLTAGAGAVIGGSGPNFARAAGIEGADLLGLWVRRLMTLGLEVERALRMAKRVVRAWPGDRIAKDDALAFSVFKSEVV